MRTDLELQNKKLELIQWLSTFDDIEILEKISELIYKESQKDWWKEIPEEEKKAIEKGIAEADSGKLNPHSKAHKLYGKWV
ncbi:MAG: hypothetical protein EA412_07835 [Chitinophagaceae bacterium]|nr:MAG: hypothetical protein EA412_07835 [Chitinophagaceae bacterium]